MLNKKEHLIVLNMVRERLEFAIKFQRTETLFLCIELRDAIATFRNLKHKYKVSLDKSIPSFNLKHVKQIVKHYKLHPTNLNSSSWWSVEENVSTTYRYVRMNEVRLDFINAYIKEIENQKYLVKNKLTEF